MTKNPQKKTILIISGYPLNEITIKNRITPIVNIGLHEGYKFTILCAGNASLDVDSPDLRYVRVGDISPKPNNLYIRAVSEFSAALKIFQVASTLESNISFVTIPSMFCLFLARRTAPLMILDVRDLTWEYLSGSLLKNLIRSTLRFVVAKKVKFFDFICCTNKSEADYFLEKMKIDHARLVLLSNGISEDAFSKLSEIKLKDNRRKINITYVGNLGIAQNLSTLLDAARELPEADFQIVGDGVQFLSLKNKVKDEAIFNVYFYGSLDFKDILSVYQRSQILYAQLSKNYRTAVPSKLYEYLSTGRCIIYGGEGQATEFLSKFDGVKVIPPDDVWAIVCAIRELINSPNSMGFQVNNIKRINKCFIREKSSEKIFERISEWQFIQPK